MKSTQLTNGPYALDSFRHHIECHEHNSLCKKGDKTIHYEHGQLWIFCSCGTSWSVEDAEGGPAVNGYDFEQVSKSPPLK